MALVPALRLHLITATQEMNNSAVDASSRRALTFRICTPRVKNDEVGNTPWTRTSSSKSAMWSVQSHKDDSTFCSQSSIGMWSASSGSLLAAPTHTPRVRENELKNTCSLATVSSKLGVCPLSAHEDTCAFCSQTCIEMSIDVPTFQISTPRVETGLDNVYMVGANGSKLGVHPVQAHEDECTFCRQSRVQMWNASSGSVSTFQICTPRVYENDFGIAHSASASSSKLGICPEREHEGERNFSAPSSAVEIHNAMPGVSVPLGSESGIMRSSRAREDDCTLGSQSSLSVIGEPDAKRDFECALKLESISSATCDYSAPGDGNTLFHTIHIHLMKLWGLIALSFISSG